MVGRKRQTKEFPPSIRWLDDAAEAHYFNDFFPMAGGHYQPLTGWLSQVLARMGTKKEMAMSMKQYFGVDAKTLFSGMPKRASRISLMVNSGNRWLEQRYADSNAEIVSWLKTLMRLNHQAAEEDADALPCHFHLTGMGAFGCERFHQLCHGVDMLGKAVRAQEISRRSVGQWLPRLANHVMGPSCVHPEACCDLDPGLDAMLMLLARLDRETARSAFHDQEKSMSLFLLVAGKRTDDQKPRFRRLLDVYYGVAMAAKSGKGHLPVDLPAIDDLARELLGADVQESSQSLVRWRNGERNLWRTDVDSMAAHVDSQTHKDPLYLFMPLLLAAQFWAVLRQCDDYDHDLVVERYTSWWRCLADAGIEDVDPYGYWALI